MQRKPPRRIDYGLALLLDYDGRIEYLPGGYYLKFVIRSVKQSTDRPHGLSYSFTLHDPRHKRVMGFDNAHRPKPLRRGTKQQTEHDHWHRTVSDKGRPYAFVDAATLLQDFYAQAERVLRERGIELDVIDESSTD
jgi:hypothetical protein